MLHVWGGISIIIAAYNAGMSIGRLLDSILASHSEKIEVIVVDDGSADDTFSIVDEYRSLHQDDANILLIHQDNLGVSTARNYGIKFAHHEYIWFVDADDEINPEVVADLMQVCAKSPDLVWMNTIHDQDGHVTTSNDRLSALNEDISIAEFRSNFKGAGMLWQFLLRKSIILEHGVQFVEWAKWFEDVDFLLHYQCYIHTLSVYSKNWCYRYYINPEGAMRNSKYSERLACSVKLSVQSFRRNCPDQASRIFIEQVSAVSLAWCLREANGVLAKELYAMVRPFMPLRLAGTWKQKLQIFLLNINFRLYKKLF